MKNLAQLVVAMLFISLGIFQACDTPAQRVDNAKENAADANRDYIIEVEKFKIDTESKLAENDKQIERFNQQLKNENAETRADYQKKIAQLELQNSDLRRRMAGHRSETKADWEQFKSEFSRDMDKLGKSFKDFTVKNN